MKTICKTLSFVVSIGFITALIPLCMTAAAEEAQAQPIMTDYQPTITETIDKSGFKHPGVGLTKDILENMRTQVREQKEPWYSYYKDMIVSAAASKTDAAKSSNESSSDVTKPGTDAFNSQGVEAKFIADGLKAYTQALLYYITGDETYRSNAMHIIRIWSQMNPKKYAYYTDACIHSGIPLNRMVTAAEILKYSSCQKEALKWTDEDTKAFTTNLITPVIETFQHDQNHFMNQHSYPLIGAMSGYIFTGNRDRYSEVVEWFTVNKTAKDQGFNGSIKQLFRLVDTNALTGEKLDKPMVEHVEMGRDQAHGGGDLTNSAIICRMLLAQGTKVDPVKGTESIEINAVGPYEFLNDRILTTANYFWRYMLGYDTPWVPVAYSIAPNGTTRDTYNQLATGYKGRFNTANFWDIYSYYTYVKGDNIAEKAPYYYEAFTKKLPSNFYYGGGLNINWNNVDGGGDFWIYLPAAAEADAAKFIAKAQTSPYLIELEDRYTAFDTNTTSMQEGGISFVRFNATKDGSKIALLNASTSKKTIGFKIRTNGTAKLEMAPGIKDTLALPDTRGQWMYVTYTMNEFQNLGDIVYLKVKGTEGTKVDIDHMNVEAGAQLTPPVYKIGSSDENIYAYVGAPISIDLSAKDSSSTDVVTYYGSNIPEGAVLDTSTGSFIWKPTQAGNYSFVAEASDGTTVTAKNINIVITNDRTSAVKAAIVPYNSSIVYVSTSLNNYNTIYNDTISKINAVSDIEFYKQLQTLRTTVENLQLVTPLLKTDSVTTYQNSIDYHNIVKSSTFGTAIINLVDGDNTTGSSYMLAPNLYHILDFGEDYRISANAFGFQSNIFADRLAGSAVFGSNDKSTWTRLTPGETSFTQCFQTLPVDDALKNAQFRFIKIQLIDPKPDIIHDKVQNLFEMTEFRIYGQRYEVGNKLQSISLSADQSVSGKVSIGDTAKLTIIAKEAINNVKVKIQGVNAEVTTTGGSINWIASAVLNGDLQTGPIKFSIDYKRNDGTNAYTIYMTTDNSSLFLVDGTKFINVPKLAVVTASAIQWPGKGLSATQVGYLLFDGDISTYGDLNTASGSYYTIDFGEGSSVNLNEILLMPRTSYSGRLNGLIVQGSNDNVNWTNLTLPLKAAQDNTWSDIRSDAMLVHNNYRYLKLYNSAAWSGDVAEVEFYGDYK